jgi:hypothetical protein
MAIIQALFAFVARSLGRILTALFDWAVVALFGRTSGASHLRLSALVAAAAAWPLLVLGIVAPRLASFVVAFVPLSDRVPEGMVRGIWVALAVAVPIAIGIAMAARRPADGRAPAEPAWRRVARGFPITMGLAAAFAIMLVAVPLLRVASIVRRRQDVHVPLVTTPESYGLIAARIAPILTSHGIPVQPAEPPWWIAAPSRVLLRMGGDAFRGFVPERPAYARGAEIEVALYPSGLLLRGVESTATHAHGVLVESLAGSPAFQALHPDAQALERRIQQAWARRAELPADGPTPSALRASVDTLVRDLAELAVPYEDWQTLYRELLQLDRALRGRPQLLERTDGQEADMTTDGQPPIPVSRLAGAPQPHGARLSELSTLELVSRFVRTASHLIQRETELAKVEARADIAATVEMARRLAVAAVAGLVGVTMLFVALAFALTAWLPGWAAALIIAAVVLAVAAVAAMSGWGRRVRMPLARTRESVKEDLEWVKQRIA